MLIMQIFQKHFYVYTSTAGDFHRDFCADFGNYKPRTYIFPLRRCRKKNFILLKRRRKNLEKMLFLDILLRTSDAYKKVE